MGWAASSAAGYSPPRDLDDRQRREFHEALLDVGDLEDLPARWQAAIVRAEQSRPAFRLLKDG